jgi:hypothetical protein
MGCSAAGANGEDVPFTHLLYLKGLPPTENAGKAPASVK